MDWKGQKLAEQVMLFLLIASAVAGFITGYSLGSFRMMLLVYFCGVVLTSLVVLPNWPFFNRHHLNRLEPSAADRHPKPPTSGSKNKSL